MGKHDRATIAFRKREMEPTHYVLSPLVLGPGETVHGTIPFVVNFPTEDYGLFDVVRLAAMNKLSFSLVMSDPISGTKTDIPLPGKYPPA
jgi:hypothetical protein